MIEVYIIAMVLGALYGVMIGPIFKPAFIVYVFLMALGLGNYMYYPYGSVATTFISASVGMMLANTIKR